MKTRIILALLGLLAFSELSFGLRIENSMGVKPDWPKGIIEVVRHPSRVYSLDISGKEDFYYQSKLDEINELMRLFAKARMRDHVIRLEAGTNNTVKAFNGTAYEYNVRLHTVGGICLAVMREKEMNGSLEPVVELTIYVGADRSLLQQLKLPDQVIVECAVEGVNLKGKHTKPQRQVWGGAVRFDDGQPANGWEHGVYTRITLWEQDSPDGITLAQVTSQGLFRAAFSEDEITALRQGRSWLTITVGNQGAVAKKDDPRFPADELVREAERVRPQRVAGPTYYYGRILFEDGTPPVLDRKLWPRAAQIMVEFPFSVYARPDGEGYFQVSFSPEQLAQAKAEKPEKNIWVPVNDQGNGGAVGTFPVAILSTDKAKAGVVRIPKPGFLTSLRSR